MAVAAMLLWCLPAFAAGKNQGGIDFLQGNAKKSDCVKVMVKGAQRCLKNIIRDSSVPLSLTMNIFNRFVGGGIKRWRKDMKMIHNYRAYRLSK
jgi:hypothetical protein